MGSGGRIRQRTLLATLADTFLEMGESGGESTDGLLADSLSIQQHIGALAKAVLLFIPGSPRLVQSRARGWVSE